jgi:hypothetical protein
MAQLPTVCFCNGAVTSCFKALSSFNVFVSWDRTRLRKGTTAETQTLVVMRWTEKSIHGQLERVSI